MGRAAGPEQGLLGGGAWREGPWQSTPHSSGLVQQTHLVTSRPTHRGSGNLQALQKGQRRSRGSVQRRAESREGVLSPGKKGQICFS